MTHISTLQGIISRDLDFIIRSCSSMIKKETGDLSLLSGVRGVQGGRRFKSAHPNLFQVFLLISYFLRALGLTQFGGIWPRSPVRIFSAAMEAIFSRVVKLALAI